MENEAKKKEMTRPRDGLSCMVCGGVLHKPYADKNGYHMRKCAACGLVSVFPLPKDDESAAVYAKDYFSGASKGFGYVDYDADKEAMRPVFVRYLAHIERLLPSAKAGAAGSRAGSGKSVGRLMDIGAATGFFVALANGRGWEASGIEISEYAAGLARSRGLDVKTGTLDGFAAFPAGSFDLVTMWDVIEHMPDPSKDLARAWDLLKKGGLLAINTPDSGSLYARIMGSRWHLLVPPEHIWYFNRKSLKSLLDENGFEALEIGCVGKLFTLEYVLHTLYRWQKLGLWRSLLSYAEKHAVGKLAVPINLRDNMFVLARKR